MDQYFSVRLVKRQSPNGIPIQINKSEMKKKMTFQIEYNDNNQIVICKKSTIITFYH